MPGLPYPTYKTMLQRIAGDIDFAILNGDWVYEEKRDDIESIKEGNVKLYKTPWSEGEEVGKEDEE